MRLLEIVHADTDHERVAAILKGQGVFDHWGSNGVTKCLVQAGGVESLMDVLQHQAEARRITVLPVEATHPAPAVVPNQRLSRAELMADVEHGTHVSTTFLILVALSSIVAAIGLITDSVAVLIGAMVVAPLLGPNLGLTLATTLGDRKLLVRSARTLLVGLGLGFAIAFVYGTLTDVTPTNELTARTQVGWTDLGLALAAGVAGALSATTALSGTLIGVMVAVAMMPPLVAAGMLLAAGDPAGAWGAIVLLGVNIGAVNLAGVATFMAQGIRPWSWWDAERARKASLKALAAWTVVLALLVLAMTQR